MGKKRMGTSGTDLLLLVLAALVLALPSGCSWGKTKRAVIDAKDEFFHTKPTTKALFAEDSTPLTDLNAEAADDIIFSIQGRLSPDSPIYVERFVNASDPNDASPFGRIMADQVATRMAQRKYRIMMGQPPPATPNEGPAAEKPPSAPGFKKDYQPQPSLLSGSYTIGEDVIYVAAKLTRIEDGAVLTGLNWTLPVNKNTRELMPQLKRAGDGLSPSVQITPPPRGMRY